jgi:hypothetical protein
MAIRHLSSPITGSGLQMAQFSQFFTLQTDTPLLTYPETTSSANVKN